MEDRSANIPKPPAAEHKGSFVSAQQVAELAGVSRSAVSRTFTEGASVSDSTRQKVLNAANVLGYHVNHLARSLIQEDSRIVCVIGAEIATPYQARMLEALSRHLQGIGRIPMLINTSADSSSSEAALRQALHYRASATIVLSGAPPGSLIQTCVDSGQQVFLINRDDHIDRPETLWVDNARAAGEAFHMFRRAGCRALAVVSSTNGTPSLVAREKGFEEAARAAGLEVSVARCGPTSYASGFMAGQLLLSGSGRPDAAFCVTDLLACGFIDAARFEFEMEIPGDLCVIGFDDIDEAGWSAYALTTFRQPVEEMARHIAKRIQDARASTASATTACFQAKPIWRRTVRPR